MKAVVLAAGYATRLGAIAEGKPKPLLSVGGKPIISHIVVKLALLDAVDEIVVVSNALFYEHFISWKESLVSSHSFSQRITIISDGTTCKEERLGAVGDICFAISSLNLNDDLLIIGGDNLFEDDLVSLMNSFTSRGSSILLNDVKDLEKAKLYGIVSLGENGKITSFEEKPEKPTSTLASTLIYALKKKDLPLLREVVRLGIADRTGDFIRYLAKQRDIYGLPIKGRWFDIGSPEQLNEAHDAYDKNA